MGDRQEHVRGRSALKIRNVTCTAYCSTVYGSISPSIGPKESQVPVVLGNRAKKREAWDSNPQPSVFGHF